MTTARGTAAWAALGGLTLGLAVSCTPADKCLGVICPGDTVCDPVSYKCVRPDGGSGGGVIGGVGGGSVGGGEETGGGGEETGGGGEVGGGGATGGGSGGAGELGGGAGGGGGGGEVDAGPPPPDAGCTGALLELDGSAFDGGVANVIVDLSTASDFGSGGCVSGGGTGLQQAFHLSLSSPQLLSVVAAPSLGADAVLYVKTPSCDAPADVACVDRGVAGESETLTRVSVGPGDYVLVVDTYDATSSGTISVTVTLEPSGGSPPNDSCTHPQPLVFDGGTLTVGGDTSFADNSNVFPDGTPYFTPSCSPSAALTGKDVVYTLVVPSGSFQDVTLTVTPSPGSDFLPVLWVAEPGGCNGYFPAGGSSELACGPALPGSTLTLSHLAPGAYPVWVDGRDGTFGPFTLRASLAASAIVGADEDVCTAARALTLDDAGTAHATGSLLGRYDNSSAACGYGPGKDVYYRFTTPVGRHLTAVATPLGDAGYRPLLYLLPSTGCLPDAGVVTSPLTGCAPSGSVTAPARLEVSFVDAGTYLLAVDALGGTWGDFALDLALDPVQGVPSNDACANATPLVPTPTPWGGIALVNGTTRLAANDFGPLHGAICGVNGPDVFYKLTTPPVGFLGYANYKVTIWPGNAADPPPVPVMELYPSCTGSVIACSNVVAGQQIFNAWNQPANTSYIVMMDTALSPGFPFTLELQMTNVPADNDTCAYPTPLPLDTSVEGNTLAAKADYAGSSAAAGGFYAGAPSCQLSLPGADVVYSFTTGGAGIYTVRVVPDRSFDPAIAVTTGCAAGSCLGQVDQFLEGEPERLLLNAAAGTTYFVFIDSFGNNPGSGPVRGGFIVSVSGPGG